MDEVQEKYDAALRTLVDKIQADPYILAAILMGSLAYDTVWRRSDIDLLLVTQETRLPQEGLCLVESGISINSFLTTRSGFRRILEGSVQGSFLHSTLVKGRMLFCREEPLAELFEARHYLSQRDRAIQLLSAVSRVLPGFVKAEKWFYAKRDFDYCSFWILKCVDALATIEVLLHDAIPGREVIHQALAYNAALFRVLYTDLLHGHAAEANLERTLGLIRGYLHAHAGVLFEPIFSYLREEGELRSMTDINHYFSRHFNIESVGIACEWLADEGFLQKLAMPVRLTDKSRTSVEEAAYYFAGEELLCDPPSK
jgi:predicted nucleotidyltransferase